MKLVIVFLIMVSVSFGQWNLKKNKTSDGKYTEVESVGKDTAGINVFVLGTFGGGQFTKPSGMTGDADLSYKADTLSGASDTVSFNFNNQFRTVSIVLKDTTGGSGLIDSVKIETYNTALNTWGTKIVGLYEAGTGNIWLGDVIVPGNGITEKYYLVDLFPSQIRVTWVYGANKVNRIMPISFEGSN